MISESSVIEIATEAAKPFSKFVDALIGPRIVRIRNWAEKQDLTGMAQGSLISIYLREYLRQLLRRISQVTTIIAPHHPLPITDIYEPLLLEPQLGLRRTRRIRFEAASIRAGESYLIVDSAGMGKSTFAKHLILDITGSTIQIPLFLELRKLKPRESLLERLAAEIDPHKKDIDERVLQLLLEQGNYTIVLDGFDELPEELRGSISEQIADIATKYDKNSLVLTARPETSLPELPQSKVFAIRPLTPAQAKSLIHRYDIVSGSHIGKKLIKQLRNVDKEYLKSPLLVVLLYRSFSFNQSIANRVTVFFDEVFNALYKGHDLTKSGFTRRKDSGLDPDEFRRLTGAFAFRMVLGQTTSIQTATEAIAIINQAMRLSEVTPSSPSKFLDDLLLAVPLLTKDGTEFRFIHKSIGEYFAAEFLARHPLAEATINRIVTTRTSDHFVATLDYLADINPQIFRRTVTLPLANRALSLQKPGHNRHLATISFFGSALLGIWPTDVYRIPGTALISGLRDIPRKHNGVSLRSAMMTNASIGKKPYFLTWAYLPDIPLVPSKAWDMITEEVGEPPVFDDMAQRSLIYVLAAIGEGEWVDISDPRLAPLLEHPGFMALMNLIAKYATGRRIDNKPTRLLHPASCTGIQDKVDREIEEASLIEALLTRT